MDADRAIPPYDLDATEPADVYKFSDLITVQESNVLKYVSLVMIEFTVRVHICHFWASQKQNFFVYVGLYRYSHDR